jgi:hypothetical protein
MRFYKRFRDLAIGAGLALAALIIAESALRIGGYVSAWSATVHGSDDRVFEPHPVYQVALKPGLKKWFSRAEHTRLVMTKWSTNSQSFRGDEVQVKKPGIRVVVYGDSNIFAQFSSIEATFAYRLQHLLHEASRVDVEVINAGVPGFGPDQSFLRFENEVNVLKPDIVVFHVFADNDFGDIVRNRLFTVSPSGDIIRTLSSGQSDPCFTNDKACLPELSQGAAKRLLASLVVIDTARRYLRQVPFLSGLADPSASSIIRAYLNLCQTEYDHFQRAEWGRASHFADHYDYDVALFPGSVSAKLKIRLMRGILGLAKRLAEKNNVRLVVLIEPSSMDLTMNLSPNFTDFSAYSDYRPEGLSRIVEEAAKVHKLDVINLFDIFSKNSPQDLYFPDGDDHWTDSGQLLASRVVADHLTHYVSR